MNYNWEKKNTLLPPKAGNCALKVMNGKTVWYITCQWLTVLTICLTFNRIVASLETWWVNKRTVWHIFSCFQMAYRRDVSYYHQVSASVHFLLLLICVFIFRARVAAEGFKWDSGKKSPMIYFNKSCRADENKSYNSTSEKQTFKKCDFLALKKRANFQCQI